jgi:enoyl-CoA hydratase/carnithine racemase
MDHIQMTCDGAVGIITIDRRERFNSLDVATAQEFRKAGLQFARDESVRCVVIRGAGGVFCSGADLKYIASGGDERDFGYLQPDGVGPTAGFGESFKQILEYIHSTISEIAGAEAVHRRGRGDRRCRRVRDRNGMRSRLRVGAGEFRVGLPQDEPLTGAESSTFFLPRLIGLRKAMELVLLNPASRRRLRRRWVDHRVFPAATFEADVLDVARRLAAGPTRARRRQESVESGRRCGPARLPSRRRAATPRPYCRQPGFR